MYAMVFNGPVLEGALLAGRYIAEEERLTVNMSIMIIMGREG